MSSIAAYKGYPILITPQSSLIAT
ncbi:MULTISPECIES: hypothetical protein [Clostridium]